MGVEGRGHGAGDKTEGFPNKGSSWGLRDVFWRGRGNRAGLEGGCEACCRVGEAVMQSATTVSYRPCSSCIPGLEQKQEHEGRRGC